MERNDIRDFVFSIKRKLKSDEFKKEVEDINVKYTGVIMYNIENIRSMGSKAYVSYLGRTNSKFSLDIGRILPESFIIHIGDDYELLKATIAVVYRYLTLSYKYDDVYMTAWMCRLIESKFRIKLRYVHIERCLMLTIDTLSKIDISNDKKITYSYEFDKMFLSIIDKLDYRLESNKELARLMTNIVRLRHIRKPYKIVENYPSINERDLAILVLASRVLIKKIDTGGIKK